MRWGVCSLLALPLLLACLAGCRTKERIAPQELPDGSLGKLVSWSFPEYDRRAQETTLPVKLKCASAVRKDPHLKVLTLKAELTNDSDVEIKTYLAHEWHGGIWGYTAIHAIVTSSQVPSRASKYFPVYIAGEDPKIEKPIAVSPANRVSFNLRMDWPGTGSLRAMPLMGNWSRSYDVELLMVFTAAGETQYVLSPRTKVVLTE